TQEAHQSTSSKMVGFLRQPTLPPITRAQFSQSIITQETALPSSSLYRRLGSSNLRVSRLCLGTMMFGGATDKAESARILASARERGLNFIDTADVYSNGGSEEVLGEL